MSLIVSSAPVTNPPIAPKALTAGQKRLHPSHIPSHLPEFPDPHTYIKTPVRNWKEKALASMEPVGYCRAFI